MAASQRESKIGNLRMNALVGEIVKGQAKKNQKKILKHSDLKNQK